MQKIDFVATDCEDLACHTGATFLVNMACIQGCNSQTPVDLTGYTATLQVYDGTEATSIIDVTGTISDPSSGNIQFLIAPDDTSDLEIGDYSYNLNLAIGDNIFRVSQGIFEVKE